MRASKGFTLVELMITVAIVAILGAIAVPLYTGYIRDSKMAEAKANLQVLHTLEEQNLADTGAYVSGADVAALKAALPAFKPGDPAGLNFTYAVEASVDAGVPKFTATATFKDDSDIIFTIDQDNVKKDKDLKSW